ncbi:MAG: nuclear transport factor 2 family protein, partial [Ilumatobacteraceae bacterium]
AVLQQMIDRQDITDALHWYTRWVDLNRVDKQVEVFTDDGRITFYGDDGWTEGRAAIQAMITPAVAKYEATHHYISNIEITFDGADDARSMCYLHAWHRPADGGPDYTLYAQYHDVWTRKADGWRISERRLKTAGTSSRGGGGSSLEPIGRAD